MMRNQCLNQLGLLIFVLCTNSTVNAETLATTNPPPAHEKIDCRDCHLRATGQRATDSTTIKDTRCRSCHEKNLANGADPLGFHVNAGKRNCLGCHSFHDPGTVTTTRGTISVNSLGQLNTDHCLSCHDGKGSLAALNQAHLAAARLYHEQAASLLEISPSQACLNCHSNSAATSWQVAHDQDLLSFSEHASHPFEVEVEPGKGDFAHRIRKDIDPRITLFNQRIQCQTCHQITAETVDLVVAIPTTKDLCLGCHQFRNSPLLETDDLLATMVGK